MTIETEPKSRVSQKGTPIKEFLDELLISLRLLIIFKSGINRNFIKKYPLNKNQIEQIAKYFMDHPETRGPFQEFIKIRLKISSKRPGKSGEARLISYVSFPPSIYFSHIFDKSYIVSIPLEIKQPQKNLNV